MQFPTIISYLGATLVLMAFALVSFKKIQSSSTTYQALNLVGAACLAYAAFTTKSFAFVILNTVWALVALATLAKAYSAKT
jgi:hypothetical protein